ncbi:hypothetical protein BCAR13_730001 [Paraburkholderia caribensis]|nr:hypothetical protein BCAR13_730001 [Paraburkholderia caribensis]
MQGRCGALPPRMANTRKRPVSMMRTGLTGMPNSSFVSKVDKGFAAWAGWGGFWRAFRIVRVWGRAMPGGVLVFALASALGVCHFAGIRELLACCRRCPWALAISLASANC